MFLLESLKKLRNSDSIAQIYRESQTTYCEMDKLSEAFAAYLLGKFGDSDAPVLVYGHKETCILPLLYGALKSGRAYVPVDITVPADRAQMIIDEVRPCVTVDLRNMNFLHENVLDGAGIAEIFATYRGEEVSAESWVKGDENAYILFTSGSTGRPKGVPITAANVENLHRNFTETLKCDGDVVLNQISYSFDVSVCSIYLAMSLGMTLFTVDKAMNESFSELFENLERSNLALWISTPSFAEMCLPSARFCEQYLPKIERFVFCGEVLTHKLVDELMVRFPRAKIFNTYGPTEATVLVSAVEIDAEIAADERSIPIGAPLPEVTLRVVGSDGEELADGERGELQIISNSVGHGYINRPEQTEKVFFFDEKLQKCGYRTGDLCYKSGSQFYYCGRIDNQIKVAGHRVEIEDIENNLNNVENVSRAAVLPVYEDEKIAYLAAFIVLKEQDGLSSLKRSIAVKNALARTLPSYMIPRRIAVIERMPLNTNGKVDKKALAEMTDK